MESYKDCMDLAKVELRQARALVQAEIHDYPTPIAGCDVQFNQLLAERKRIGEALRALQLDVFVPTPRTLEPQAGIESR